MIRVGKRGTALLLSLLLLWTALPFATVTTVAAEEPLPYLAYVPIDNRPVGMDRVKYAAAAAGFDVQMPDEVLYRTLLDGQGTNPNGTGHGDGQGIMTWLETMEANGCDLYIIHLDQLLSGGLVGSRDPDNTSGGANAEECALLGRLAAITDKKKANGEYENRVCLIDTVMRLASTGGYKGLELPEYNAFRAYAEKDRKLFPVSVADVADWDGAVGYIDTVYANYNVAPDGSTIGYSDVLTADMMQRYHNARRRKLDLLHWLRMYMKNTETTTLIFGIDDASPKVTIQNNELAFIRALLNDYEIYLSPDTDSSGLMALARCVCDHYGVRPTIRVRYFGDMADAAADGFDVGTLRENMRTHVASLQATYADERENTSATADMEVLVLTRIAENHDVRNNGASAAYEQSIRALADRAKANIASDVPTIVVDASNMENFYFSWVKGLPNLQETLLSEVEISKLLGYSNWNTVGNSIGIAMGTGVSRYAYLVATDGDNAAADVAFQQSMTYSFIKDITYNARNKEADFEWQFKYWLKYKAGWNDSNFYAQMIAHDQDYKLDWELCGGERYVNNELEWCMMWGGDPNAYSGCAGQVLNVLMSGDYYTKLGSTVKTADVDTISLSRFRLPWYRLFEVTFDVTISESLLSADRIAPSGQSGEAYAAWLKAKLGASDVTVTAPGGGAFKFVGTGYHVVATVNGRVQSFTAVIRGDVTGDGYANTSDVRRVLEGVLGQKTFTPAEQAAADADGNGEASSSDAREILQASIL